MDNKENYDGLTVDEVVEIAEAIAKAEESQEK